MCVYIISVGPGGAERIENDVQPACVPPDTCPRWDLTGPFATK